MLFLWKTGETIWKFPLSTNPPISEQFFHDPPLCPNFKIEIPPIFPGEETMNDLSNNLSSTATFFADDTSLFFCCK